MQVTEATRATKVLEHRRWNDHTQFGDVGVLEAGVGKEREKPATEVVRRNSRDRRVV